MCVCAVVGCGVLRCGGSVRCGAPAGQDTASPAAIVRHRWQTHGNMHVQVGTQVVFEAYSWGGVPRAMEGIRQCRAPSPCHGAKNVLPGHGTALFCQRFQAGAVRLVFFKSRHQHNQ